MQTDSESIQAQAATICNYFLKIDMKVRARFFPDPVAWLSIDALNTDEYENVIEYPRYCLACEIEKTEPVDRYNFFHLDIS